MKTEARYKRDSSIDIAVYRVRAQHRRAEYVRSTISSLFSHISRLGQRVGW